MWYKTSTVEINYILLKLIITSYFTRCYMTAMTRCYDFADIAIINYFCRKKCI